MDLERYFDTINHSKLIEILSRTIKDGRVFSQSQVSIVNESFTTVIPTMIRALKMHLLKGALN